MADYVCPEENALKPGADLWVVADLSRSEWAQKIDWYLNFQIVRAGVHSKAERSSELNSVINQWEFDPPDIDSSSQLPLMIASSDLLPNHSTVVVPLAGEVKSWSKRVHEVWQKLDEPSVRVFLPESIDAKSFVSNWPGDVADLKSALVVI